MVGKTASRENVVKTSGRGVKPGNEYL